MKHRDNTIIIERLTALWALNECGLGGLMHAFGTPFTGILVGGISILLISLIATYSTKPRPVLIKALIIVLLVKLSVSPHSPITAYLAVSFQASLGILLYSAFKVNRITIILLGMLTFFESAVQKVITLTLLYGQSVWEAIDVYGAWINAKFSFVTFQLSTKNLIILYVGFYILAGFIVSHLIIRTISVMQSLKEVNTPHLDNISNPNPSTSKKTTKARVIRFWSISILLILLALVFLKPDLGGWELGIYVIARSLLILGIWYTILGPFLLRSLRRLLSKHQSVYQADLQHTLELLPHLKAIIYFAWQDCKSLRGFNRMQHFLAKSIVYSVHFKHSRS